MNELLKLQSKPAFALGLNPTEQFMLCCHTQGLADTFSRNVRNLIDSEPYRELFPATRLSSDSATVQKWTLDGFTRPAMLAVGVGGSPTGHGAKILLIDDPIAHVDDLNCLSFLDYLRDVALQGKRQIFFATANEKIASLFERKFDFLGSVDFRKYVLAREL